MVVMAVTMMAVTVMAVWEETAAVKAAVTAEEGATEVATD